jgi:hypothetical protein
MLEQPLRQAQLLLEPTTTVLAAVIIRIRRVTKRLRRATKFKADAGY